MKTLRLEEIPVGREGWVYLIHALGTNRYKVGRSVNPVTRTETLKKQSPYPLEIIQCTWTINAVTDEKAIHEKFKDYRVYGEWFELSRLDGVSRHSPFGNDPLSKMNWEMLYLKTMRDVMYSHQQAIEDLTGISRDQLSQTMFACDLVELFAQRVQSIESFNRVNLFLANTLFHLTQEYLPCFRNQANEICPEKLDLFLSGAVKSFTFSTFRRVQP